MCKIQGKKTCGKRCIQVRGRAKILLALRDIHEGRRTTLSMLQQADEDKVKQQGTA